MEITKKQGLIIMLLGLIGGVLGSVFYTTDNLAKDHNDPSIAVVDSAFLFYHREAVAQLMGQPNAYQIALQYRKNLPGLLHDHLETKNLLIFDRVLVVGGATDLTGALAEDYLQALDRQSTDGRGIQ